jgi:hypothetical protein
MAGIIALNFTNLNTALNRKDPIFVALPKVAKASAIA